MKTTVEEVMDEIYEGLLEDLKERRTINVDEPQESEDRE